MQDNTPKLNIEDVQFLVNLVPVCLERGAFKVDEIAEVGQTYQRVLSFLNSISQPQSTENTEITEQQ